MSKLSDLNLIIKNYKNDLLCNQSLTIGSIQDEIEELLRKDTIKISMVG